MSSFGDAVQSSLSNIHRMEKELNDPEYSKLVNDLDKMLVWNKIHTQSWTPSTCDCLIATDWNEINLEKQIYHDPIKKPFYHNKGIGKPIITPSEEEGMSHIYYTKYKWVLFKERHCKKHKHLSGQKWFDTLLKENREYNRRMRDWKGLT